MDLSQYALAPTKTFNLCDPVGNEIELPDGSDPDTGIPIMRKVTITVCHSHEAGAQKFKSELTQRRISKMSFNARRPKLDASGLEEEATQFLAYCIKSWDNVILGGVRLECTEANKLMLLSDPKFYFIRDQVDQIVNSDAEFMGNALRS